MKKLSMKPVNIRKRIASAEKRGDFQKMAGEQMNLHIAIGSTSYADNVWATKELAEEFEGRLSGLGHNTWTYESDDGWRVAWNSHEGPVLGGSSVWHNIPDGSTMPPGMTEQSDKTPVFDEFEELARKPRPGDKSLMQSLRERKASSINWRPGTSFTEEQKARLAAKREERKARKAERKAAKKKTQVFDRRTAQAKNRARLCAQLSHRDQKLLKRAQ